MSLNYEIPYPLIYPIKYPTVPIQSTFCSGTMQIHAKQPKLSESSLRRYTKSHKIRDPIRDSISKKENMFYINHELAVSPRTKPVCIEIYPSKFLIKKALEQAS